MHTTRITRKRQAGQSIVEFAFLLPLIVGMLFLLIETEIAISSAIVNSRYARQHMHFLMFNHRYYFEHENFLRRNSGRYMQRFWIGVDDNVNFGVRNPVAHAPTRKIGRMNPPPAEDGAQGDVSARQNVRIRVSSFTCLPPVGLNVGQPFTERHLREDTFANGNFAYCEDR